MEVDLHDASPGLRGKHGDQSSPQSSGCCTANSMDNVWFSKRGDENAEDHLILLTPCKKGRIDHGGRGTSIGAGIWNNLGRSRR
jgi:hypothetical protein